MLGKTPKYHQVNVFQTPLRNFINMEHELIKLAETINWDAVEAEFKAYFAELGRPGVPIRKMVGLMLLKSLYNLSDENTVARWVENPYYQYFTGEFVFQTKPPIDPADFSKFRRRIGEQGAEKLLKLSIELNADECVKETEVMVDTTVQEKNITFPTDVKLTRKVIARCLKMARKENISLRRTYTRELKKLNLQTRFMNHPKRKREGLKAKKRLQTIGKALVNDYTKQKARKKFCRRAGIEPVIGHIKQDHRMQRNYLKGTQGDAINTMLAAAGYNLKHWLNKLIFVFKTIYKIIIAEILNFLTLAQTKQKLMLAMSSMGKRGFWQV